MKTVVVLLLSLAAISCAQDKKTENEKTPAGEKKRLASVTWDLKSHKLTWVVQKGTENGSAFVASSADSYEISPDDAIMAFADEKRGFTKEEAASLHKLLDTLSLYCAESVVWWDQGEGDRLDGSPSNKDSDKDKEESKPGKGRQRVDQPAQPSKPVRPMLVAHIPAQ